ncbi:PIN domain-containing protein [Candidatus Palauibacter sp.]|uniref:PIN domain-containing protein n=1 Tax=Candidatus Palauibacter sp. TaxID=3101350 RepID=UPI003B025BA0
MEELWFGVTKAGWGDKRRNDLRQHLEAYDVVWPDPRLLEVSARLRSEMERIGRRLSTADAWIAATALRLACPLACYDRDFSHIMDLELVQAPPSAGQLPLALDPVRP